MMLQRCANPSCSNTFNVKPSRAEQGKDKYCSAACRHAAKYAPCTCLHCGKSFEVLRILIEQGRGKYCSKACYDLAQTTGRVTQACEQCGQSFETYAYYVERGQMRYCSRACVSKAHHLQESARFWEKIQVCKHGRTCTVCCWPWLAAKNVGGYGVFGITINGKARNVPAHVYAWENKNGPMPEGKQGNHIQACPLRACCNDAHIYPGTKQENTQDAVDLGHLKELLTSERTQGEKNVKAKLTEEQVRTIRQSKESANILAVRFNVSASMIRHIRPKKGKSKFWTHI